MMKINEPTEIKAQITINARYEDDIVIIVQDRISGARFLEMSMTREQFINATMNKQANVDVRKAEVRNLDLVGKRMEMKILEFPLPEGADWREYTLYKKGRNVVEK